LATPATDDFPSIEELAIQVDAFFRISNDVRYVALYLDGELALRERSGPANASASELDKYEELIVNPSVLTLVRQRGNIDCGGVKFVVIRYGNFWQGQSGVDTCHWGWSPLPIP
jgi:hypothetical protein